MQKSLPGGLVTYETRREANDTVDKQKRYAEIKYILSRFPNGLTAKQIAVQMKRLGYTDSDERNWAAPRLTEMSYAGVVEPVGKIKCAYTGKKVSIYRLVKEPEQQSLF